jgi:hypothetical protein
VANRVYALLVGVNDYPPPIESLDGCLNDVDLLHEHLTRQAGSALAAQVLKNDQATRANVIAGFRSHLGQARAGDVALFQFCGHGARWASSAAFRALSPDGMDEGLVCADSRRPGGYDLADKELAVLIAEVAATGAHTVVLLDACHSGSGTRGVAPGRGARPRLTQEVATERPLESYLDGHYARLRAAGEPLFVPRGRHILLAACERGQLAQEVPAHGVFTACLLDVLTATGGAVSYADLFVRCRAAVRARAYDQDPQFETFDRFDAGAGFLDRPPSGTRGRFLVFCDNGLWTVECGAIAGIPTDPGTEVALRLFPEGEPTVVAGTARAIQVGPRTSEIALDFDSAESARYLAEITSLPAAPLPVTFAGDEATRVAIEEALGQCGAHVSLVGAAGTAGYVLAVGDGRLTLSAAGRAGAIGFVTLAGATPARAATSLAPVIRQILRWERGLTLRNPRSAIDPSMIELVFAEQLAGGGERVHEGPEAEVAYASIAGRWRRIRGRFRVRNHTGQVLVALLVCFTETYGVYVLANEPVAPGDAWITLWGDGPDEEFLLEEGVDRSLERFKLIVATEKIDDFLLAEPALVLGAEYGADREADGLDPSRPVGYANAWLTRDLRVHVVRRPA